MSHKDRIAELRQNIERREASNRGDLAELERLEREERKSRPALAAGQVWRRVKDSGEGWSYWTALPVAGGICLFDVPGACGWAGKEGFGGHDNSFEYVGLARDVLRVDVPGDVSATPSAPVQAEPTGADLVGNLCWVSNMDGIWHGPVEVEFFDGSTAPYRAKTEVLGHGWWFFRAKLYREGVEP